MPTVDSELYTFSNLTYPLIFAMKLFSGLVLHLNFSPQLPSWCKSASKWQVANIYLTPKDHWYLYQDFRYSTLRLLYFPSIKSCVCSTYWAQEALSFCFVQTLECCTVFWIIDLRSSCSCRFLKQPHPNGNKKSKIHTCLSMTTCFGNAKLVESQILGTPG